MDCRFLSHDIWRHEKLDIGLLFASCLKYLENDLLGFNEVPKILNLNRSFC